MFARILRPNKSEGTIGLFLPAVLVPFSVAVQCVADWEKRKKFPMHRPTPLKTVSRLVPNLIRCWPLRHGRLLVALFLASIALSPMARAVNPPPDGGYPNGNTAEGDNALFSNSTNGGG